MAKPPKKIAVPASPDTSSTMPSAAPEASAGSRFMTPATDPAIHGNVHTPDTSGALAQTGTDLPPSVTVSTLPDTVARLLEINMNAITWPADKTHLLRATDRGLFLSPEGGMYAHVAGEGYLQVVHQPDGRYQVFWPQALGEPGPFLKQIDGQPLWRPDAASQTSNSAAIKRPTAVETAPDLKPLRPLSSQQVALLTSAHDSVEGLRYDKRGATYLDMDDGTTFLARRLPDGDYQQISAHERYSLGARVEPVPGTKRWRVKTLEPSPALGTPQRAQDSLALIDKLPGPSKRPRLPEESGQRDTLPLTEHRLGAQPTVHAWSTEDWRNWGKTVKPQWQDCVEIDGQHYVIVPQRVLPDTTLVYLENPLFSPGRYDAFERMLSNNPSLQPKWAVKQGERWVVVQLPAFDSPLTQSVAKSFRYLSEHSSSAIARAAFNEANQSEVINGDGLRVLFDTLYRWKNRTRSAAPRRELADPLMMLPVLAAQASINPIGQTLTLPSPFATALERIDFDTQMFHQQWRNAVETPGSSLRSVFSEILQHNGYEVDRTSRLFSEDALLFQRSPLDVVFVLRFRPSAPDGTVTRLTGPGEELDAPALRATIAKSRWRHMLEPDKVVYLVGGTQKVSAQQTLLFIVREG